MMEVRKLECLPSMNELSLYGNTVTRVHEYRLILIHRMPTLRVLDGVPIADDERMRAEMYSLEQQSLLQQASCTQQTGTLEILAPTAPSMSSMAQGVAQGMLAVEGVLNAGTSLLIARAHPAGPPLPLSVPFQMPSMNSLAAAGSSLKITNVNLFNVTQNNSAAFGTASLFLF